MAYAVRPTDFHRHIAHDDAATHAKAATWRGLLRRFIDAVVESRAQAAEREAAAFLTRTGGRFTDSIERELNDRQFNGGWNLRR